MFKLSYVFIEQVQCQFWNKGNNRFVRIGFLSFWLPAYASRCQRFCLLFWWISSLVERTRRPQWNSLWSATNGSAVHLIQSFKNSLWKSTLPANGVLQEFLLQSQCTLWDRNIHKVNYNYLMDARYDTNFDALVPTLHHHPRHTRRRSYKVVDDRLINSALWSWNRVLWSSLRSKDMALDSDEFQL